MVVAEEGFEIFAEKENLALLLNPFEGWMLLMEFLEKFAEKQNFNTFDQCKAGGHFKQNVGIL